MIVKDGIKQQFERKEVECKSGFLCSKLKLNTEEVDYLRKSCTSQEGFDTYGLKSNECSDDFEKICKNLKLDDLTLQCDDGPAKKSSSTGSFCACDTGLCNEGALMKPINLAIVTIAFVPVLMTYF